MFGAEAPTPKNGARDEWHLLKHKPFATKTQKTQSDLVSHALAWDRVIPGLYASAPAYKKLLLCISWLKCHSCPPPDSLTKPL